MKYVMVAAEGLSDEPLVEFDGRTPLELSKTPAMDRIAQAGVLGTAVFSPRTLRPASDVAAMAISGFDPLEFYTGIAPLETAAAGLSQNDHEIAFRCDFVTVFDGVLSDPRAGFVSDKEAEALLKSLREKLSDARLKIYPLGGYRNLLIFDDPELAEDLDEAECDAPSAVVGKKVDRHEPRGRAAETLKEIMTRAAAVLEEHEVNRVRVDLKENPANRVWLWGQGKRPKLPGFWEKHGVNGAVWSAAGFAKGIGTLSGLKTAAEWEGVFGEREFLMIYVPMEEIAGAVDLKAKIRHIEDFDAKAVAPLLNRLEKAGPYRICVTTDNPASLGRASASRGRVPFAMAGEGIEKKGAARLTEKHAAESALIFEEGFRLLEYFLKK